jgi:hypothetical protein
MYKQMRTKCQVLLNTCPVYRQAVCAVNGLKLVKAIVVTFSNIFLFICYKESGCYFCPMLPKSECIDRFY